MEELITLRSRLQSMICGAKLSLERDECAIPRDVIIEDILTYTKELEVIEKAIKILERNKKYL